MTLQQAVSDKLYEIADQQVLAVVNTKVEPWIEPAPAPEPRTRTPRRTHRIGWKAASIAGIGGMMICMLAGALPLAWCFGVGAALASAAQ